MENVSKVEKWSNILRWALIAVYVITIIIFAGDSNIAASMIMIFGLIFMFLHAPQRYGWKAMFIFAAIAFVISTILEDLSIHTGFPFGNYHYRPVGLSIDQVPIAVGLIYVAVSYLAWTLGSIILNHADRHLDKKFNIFALPLVSTFIMVQFDLVIDPLTSTYRNGWFWEDGGGFFGVPLENFLGWYLTCYIFMQLFTLYLAKQQSKLPNKPEIRAKQYWLQPILLYISVGFGYVVQYIHNYDNVTEVTDLAGNTWVLNTMFETAVTVMVFTMLYSGILALVNLYKDKSNNPA